MEIIRPSSERLEIEYYSPSETEPLYKRPINKAEHDTATPRTALNLDVSKNDEVLNFVNRWGLLGL
ncbi:MAG: hypothetical protein ACO1OC_02480 [Tuberibacillus sp.]